jgi:iron complex transport system substrate-binding protein
MKSGCLKLLRIASLLMFVTLACSNVSAEALNFIDQAGREVTLSGHPRRVVSLAPSITEIVYALGAQQLLKGATLYSDHPEEAKMLPRVGSYVKLDLERIVALRPNLCLAVKDGNPRHIIEKLDRLGVKTFVLNQRNINDIVETVDVLGRVLGVEENADKLVLSMQLRLKRIKEMVADVKSTPRVFFQIDASPIITAGRDTFIHELITRAGGINLAETKTGYPRYSWEDILLMEPEVVIIASMAGGYSPEELKADWKKWKQIPAVHTNRVYVVDAGLIDRPTPRLLDGLETFVSIIHPELGNGLSYEKE